MLDFFSRLLPLLVLPLGATIVLMVAGIATGRRRLLIAAVVLLWMSSIPLVGNGLSRAMEAGLIRVAEVDAPPVDAIVALSAGRPIAPGPAKISEWGDGDRFFAAVQLFQAKKAPLLVFTGGWTSTAPTAPLEGDVLIGLAQQLGVPVGQAITTGRVVNTLEESRAVAALLAGRTAGPPRILLVTSAFHMDRARLLFERAGMVVEPFPVDFAISDASRLNILDFVPTAAALTRTQIAIREIYGRLFYRLVAL